MSMAQGTEKNKILGHSLHLHCTKLLEDFLKGSEDHFQYLQEILAEAKEHFGRRESVALLPKTPCMKRKRKRLARSPQASPELPSSPSQAFLKDVCKTPDSKKPATCEQPTIEASKEDSCNTLADVSTKGQRKSSRAKTNKGQKSTREPQRKQPRRGAKKVSEVVEDDINGDSGMSSGQAVTPKQPIRSKRKQSDKETEVPVENSKTNKKNRGDGAVDKEPDRNSNKAVTPKRMIRSKRKQSEKETVAPIQSANICNDIPFTPSPQAKKSKVNQTQKIPKTPQNVEVFIPETPQVQQKAKEMTPTQSEETKTVRSSLKVVLTPKLAAPEVEEYEISVCAEEDNMLVTSDVLIVEAIMYEDENHVISTSTPEKVDEEEPISEPTVTSTKKLRRETRSSVRGTKRKQASNREDDKKTKITSPISPQVQEDVVNTAQTADQECVPPSFNSDNNAVVSSTVTSPPKVHRKSFRPSRGTRRSSRLSVQSHRNERKSKVRKSKSIMRSSVVLKLSAKKLLPALVNPQEENEDLSLSECPKEDVTKAILFKGSEFNNQGTEPDPKSSQENPLVIITTTNAAQEVDEDAKVDADSNETDAEEENGSEETNVAKVDVDSQGDTDEADGEEFHDAQDVTPSDDDDEKFQEATDAAADENDDENNVVISGPRPVTRASSRHQSSGSSSNSRTGSSSSTESEEHSACKQSSDDSDRSQSSPEPSQGNCVPCGSDDGDDSDHDNIEDHDDHNADPNEFGFQNRVLKNNTGVIHSFLKRNTPKKVDRQEKSRLMKLAILEKQEKEKERIEKLAVQKQKRIEDQKRRREEKERKVAELRAAKTREQREKKEQLEKKQEMRRRLEDKAKRVREREEEAKRRVRHEKKADCDARRKQEEEQRQQKILEKEDEAKRYREMMQRKAEFEEQERQRKILEAKRQQEQREQELQREKELEKLRILKEIEERERKVREERERQERMLREEKDKEERERKRIAALLKEKEEQERKERERKAKEERQRERELKFHFQEEAEKEKQRLHKLQEQRAIEEAKLKALCSIQTDSYEMTPPPPPRVRSMATIENYNIDDICSDDSTDDEDAPKKKIPQWAQGAKLKAALINQSAMTMSEIETIFGGVSMPNLDEIFTQKKRKRFYQRTSSAHWDSPPLKTLNRGTLI